MEAKSFVGAPYISGSETSKKAAISIQSARETLTKKVWRFACQKGAVGFTDEECCGVLAMNPSTQRPRRVELVEVGLVVDSGMKRKTISGREATVWIVNPDALVYGSETSRTKSGR
jgi:hypothetical protein